jgi:transposase
MGKAEFCEQAIGMLEAGSNQAKVAELMKVSVRTMKNWWNRWTSQESLLDEKRSGCPSVLGKKAKLVISKSVHKRAWSTRKSQQTHYQRSSVPQGHCPCIFETKY